MRIIDKNYDYYDYLQSSDDRIVFDRRNSFLLTKGMVMDNIEYSRYNWDSKYRFILLQCGATYWLFLLTITGYEKRPCWGRRISDYSLELLTSWKYYDKPRVIIGVCSISFHDTYIFYDHDYDASAKEFSIDRIKSRLEDLKNKINTNDYDVDRDLVASFRWSNKKNEDIPLLKACGISQLVDPVDIFHAIEEHFSLEKSESERTEAGGTTNNDKITMHGFDVKTSFRGKTSQRGRI